MQPSLKIFDIFYGNSCNLTCSQCDTRSDLIRKKQFDPTIDDIKEGIRLTKDKFDIELYSLLGGEPLLYLEKVEEILKYIRSIDDTTIILLPTNGDLIYKHLDYLQRIIIDYRVLLMVSDHTSMFKNSARTEKTKSSVDQLVTKLAIPQAGQEDFWNNILNQRPLDTSWDDYWDTKTKLISDSNSMDDTKFWWNTSYGVYYQHQDSHVKHYYLNNNIPKPYNSVDIDSAYFKSCPSCYCTFLYNKKLYKCAALGTLRNFLSTHDSLEDPEWQKYLSYLPLDLTTCSDEEVASFSDSKFKSIKECSMCPESQQIIQLTEDNVLPIKIYKKS